MHASYADLPYLLELTVHPKKNWFNGFAHPLVQRVLKFNVFAQQHFSSAVRLEMADLGGFGPN